jgi:hypothetical protein
MHRPPSAMICRVTLRQIIADWRPRQRDVDNYKLGAILDFIAWTRIKWDMEEEGTPDLHRVEIPGVMLVARFGRRSWVSTRSVRNDGMRLSTMVVLFAVVVLLMFVSNRPEIWSRFVPDWDESVKADVAKTPQSADLPSKIKQSAPPAAPNRSSDQRSPLLMGGLLMLAVIYFAWRIARIGRAVSRRAEAKRMQLDKSRAAWATRPRPVTPDPLQPSEALPRSVPDSKDNERHRLDTAEPNPEAGDG